MPRLFFVPVLLDYGLGLKPERAVMSFLATSPLQAFRLCRQKLNPAYRIIGRAYSAF